MFFAVNREIRRIDVDGNGQDNQHRFILDLAYLADEALDNLDNM